jgi:host factor-I protein
LRGRHLRDWCVGDARRREGAAADADNANATAITEHRRATMSEKSQNVQDVFLNYLRKNKVPITVFLMNGIKLQGIIDWFDRFSVVLRHSQLVYKSTISTAFGMHWFGSRSGSRWRRVRQC